MNVLQATQIQQVPNKSIIFPLTFWFTHVLLVNGTTLQYQVQRLSITSHSFPVFTAMVTHSVELICPPPPISLLMSILHCSLSSPHSSCQPLPGLSSFPAHVLHCIAHLSQSLVRGKGVQYEWVGIAGILSGCITLCLQLPVQLWPGSVTALPLFIYKMETVTAATSKG